MLKMAMGVKKRACKKTVDFQQRLDSLQSQFDGKMITIDELFQGLTLLMATKILIFIISLFLNQTLYFINKL